MPTWGWWVLLVALPVLAFVVVRWRARRWGPAPLPIDEHDRAELAEVAEHLLWEDFARRSTTLERRLRLLLDRRVPVRALTPTGVEGRWLLGFADGSTVPVRGRRSGEVTELLVHLQRGDLRLVGAGFDGNDAVLRFSAGPRRFSLWVVEGE